MIGIPRRCGRYGRSEAWPARAPRRRFTAPAVGAAGQSGPGLPPAVACRLPQRRVLRIRWVWRTRGGPRTALTRCRSGEHARKFLQDLVTNDVAQLGAPHSRVFAVMLNPKGRGLFDIHASVSAAGGADGATHEADPSAQPERAHGVETFLLDVDGPQSALLQKHLRMYNLRTRVRVDDLGQDAAVWALLPLEPDLRASAAPEAGREGSAPPSGADGPWAGVSLREALSSDPASASSPELVSVGADTRAPEAMGCRAIVPSSVDVAKLLGIDEVEARDAYQVLRFTAGLPEGEEVFKTIPLEWSLDRLNGVSFTKGCYLGQELTARTHFTGLVRKRVVPVLLRPASAAPPAGVLPAAEAAAAVGAVRGVFRAALPGGVDPAAPRVVAGDTVTLGPGGKRAGRIVAAVDGLDVALAVIRLEHLGAGGAVDFVVGGGDDGDVRVTPFLPAWWPAVGDNDGGASGSESGE